MRKGTTYSTGHHSPYDWIHHQRIDSPVKSQKSGDKVKRFRCKAHKYEGMRRTYWYAGMSENAVQRSRWTFYKVVKN